MQELNLNYFYPSVYWNTACLTVESASDENDKAKNTNYGKIAKSIYKMKKFGVDVLPPDINKSEISFTPIEETNEILFGLGGIAKINSDIASQIIENRPYSNFNDFYNKNSYKGSLITKSIMINLIKSGAFSSINGSNPIPIMKWLCVYENPKKESLTMNNMDNAISLKVDLPNDLVRAYKFKKYVIGKKFFYCNDEKFKTKKHYILEPKFAKPYFEEKYADILKEEVDYYYDNDNLIVIDKSLEKATKKEMNQLKDILNNQEIIDEYNKKMWQKEYMNMVKVEDINKWSFESISFYANGKHELNGVNLKDYNVSKFSELPEEPKFVEKSYGKRKWKQYDISRICGTVLDRNDNNHLVDILTPDNEVVTVKFNSGQYAHYKQTVEINGVKDTNWLARGTLLMISGYKRGEDNFVAKKYKNTIFQHTVAKIESVNEDETLSLRLERLSKENEN